MKKGLLILFLVSGMFTGAKAQQVLVFHTIQTDAHGNMIPWYNPDPGTSYDHCLNLIWNFWNNIPASSNIKYYMTDHSYSAPSSHNMVGGDQFAMALSSWALYYAYTGDTALVENMVYIANMYLANSLSGSTAVWANFPYPCNSSDPQLPVYDGDFVLGAGVTQPDKAGSFGEELVNLYKITRDSTYLQMAVKIANTLAENVRPGDASNSPYPFKVYAVTGTGTGYPASWDYTTNVVPTLRLFDDLTALGVGDTARYDSAYTMIKTWVQTYPENTNQWGCFFEDIIGPSNTETNAVTMAWYILEHPNWSNTWQQEARHILDWTFNTFQDTLWNSYGVTAIFEQSVDLKPGGSHTSRYASAELVYSEKTGDTSKVTEAIRELNWATYLVDTTGECRFSPSESSVWYTDGYGDYVRHFMRAMAAYPAIAPADANHLLGSTSIISYVKYQAQEINYTSFDRSSVETLRLTSKPTQVTGDGVALNELSSLNGEGWVWTPYATGGVLKVNHNNSRNIDILWNNTAVNDMSANDARMKVYPNPASDNVAINYTSDRVEEVKIELFNVTGERLKEFSAFAQAGANNVQFNISELPGGTYFVHLVTTDGPWFKKLIIGR